MADVVAGSPAVLREVARVFCSVVLALACIFPLTAPLAWGGARLVTAGLSRWAWELATQAAWEYLEGQLWRAEPASLPPLAVNSTLAATVPAILLEAGPSTGTLQTVGAVWTWSCYALAAWRKTQSRR